MMRTRIKICGITDRAGCDAAVDLRVDAIGFVFAPSPRQIAPRRAEELARDIPPSIMKVAVFAYASRAEVQRVLDVFNADCVQCEPSAELRIAGALMPVFHDDEEVGVRVNTSTTEGDVVLLEASGRGGRGIKPNWMRAGLIARDRRLFLAGGLTPDNVGDAIALVKPYGVDVSSGVEYAPGMKDAALIRSFVHAVQEADVKHDVAQHHEDVR